jgi:hypothetical protein
MNRVTMFAVLVWLSSLGGAGAEKLIFITLKNHTPTFSAVASIEGDAIPGKPAFSPTGSSLKYQFKVPKDRWFSFLTISVTWKNAYDQDDGGRVDFVQGISLRIRRDFAQNIEIPIHFDNNRTDEEINGLGYPGIEKVKVYLRSFQIASYFRG